MSFDTAKKGIDLFLSRGLNHIRLAGADPVRNIGLVKKILEYITPEITLRITSNGVGLDADLIQYLSWHPNVELVLSVDGDKETQLLMRKSAPGFPDSFSWFTTHAEKISSLDIFKHLNMVISPETVKKLVTNVAYLAKMGFYRINFLPAYYVKWTEEQIELLRKQFSLLALFIEKGIDKGLPFYVVNLDNYSPVSLFRQELVIDSDGTLYDNDVICARMFEKDRMDYSLGNISDPLVLASLASKPRQDWEDLIDSRLDSEISESTRKVDQELSRFVSSVEPLFSK